MGQNNPLFSYSVPAEWLCSHLISIFMKTHNRTGWTVGHCGWTSIAAASTWPLLECDWAQNLRPQYINCGTGLRESCAHHFGWLKRHRECTASTYRVCEFFFGCNTAVISVRIYIWSCSIIRHPMLTHDIFVSCMYVVSCQ